MSGVIIYIVVRHCFRCNVSRLTIFTVVHHSMICDAFLTARFIAGYFNYHTFLIVNVVYTTSFLMRDTHSAHISLVHGKDKFISSWVTESKQQTNNGSPKKEGRWKQRSNKDKDRQKKEDVAYQTGKIKWQRLAVDPS